MEEFFSQMGGFEKTLWYMAVPSSLLFAIMLVLSFIGDAHGDTDINSEYNNDADSGDDHGGAFQMFTFRNFVYFFTVFSWTGIICLGKNMGNEMTLVISTIAGGAMMFLMASLFYWIHRMSENRAIRLEDSVGKTGTVDLKIPAKGQGSGKVNITLGGALRNMDAISDGKEFTRGEKVKIVKIENNELVVDQQQ